MKHLLFLAAFLALSSASAISKNERPSFCDHGKASGGATACHNPEPTYTYDHLIGKCIKILTGGCTNAHNIFTSDDECMRICGMRKVAALLNNGELKFNIFEFNSYVDKALEKISAAMKTVGADPIDIDGFVLDSIPDVKIGFKDFSLHGLSNIVRAGDWGFDANGITKYSVHGGLGVHNVSSTITTIGEVAGHGGELALKTFMNKFDVTFSFYVDLKLCTIGLDKFTLGDGLHIDIEVVGDGIVSEAVSKVVTETTNYLLTTFNETVEKATLMAAGAINVCAIVAGMVE